MGVPDRTAALPHPVDDPTIRAAQQQRLSKLLEELEAEGVDGQAAFEALQRQADTWPE